MDLIQILRKRTESLEEGSYTAGLRAVLQHVQVAANHLKRGAETTDDTAFTDAIYRTNQAFEGSLKEAFRVLATKDPEKARPFDIENFFQQNSILRGRVLEQLSRYRTEWRNPSTHDYKLDFDEDEALLAIVSVCAFAIVLIDQISERISRDRAKAAAKPQPPAENKRLADLAADALIRFRFDPPAKESGRPTREVEIIGAVAGYLEAVFPSATVSTEADLAPERHFRADILIERDSERVIVEIKRTRFAQNIRGPGVAQLSHYIALSGIREAVLLMYDDERLEVEMQREDYPLPGADARIIIVTAKRAGRSA